MLPERRLFPRFSLRFPITVRVDHADGRHEATVEAVTVSLHAVEVNAGPELVKALLSQEVYPHVCEVSFRLPEHEYEYRMGCQLSIHRRLSQHNWQLVLLFTRFHEDCGGLLAEQLGSPLPTRPTSVFQPRYK